MLQRIRKLHNSPNEVAETEMEAWNICRCSVHQYPRSPRVGTNLKQSGGLSLAPGRQIMLDEQHGRQRGLAKSTCC
jgi:hypothetical protein